MKRFVLTFICGVLWGSVLFAQAADSLLFYEPVEGGNYRFYFDDRYFLADRDCQFVAIERDGGYHPETKTMHGAFVDYDLDGRVVLTGHYVDGKKEGEFKAFHTTGHLKWEVVYRDDMPTGQWSYYYPDGRPLYVVEYRNDGMYIRDYWDQQGRHRVSNGKGRFDVTIKLDRYQEHGYSFVRRRGRVVDGKPHGTWTTQYILDGEPAMDGGFEYFSNARFVRGMNAYTEEWYSDSSRLPLLPIEPFIRAELLAGNPCNIDAYSGFLLYLKEHLESYFSDLDEEVYAQQLEYTIELDKDGMPRKISPVQSLPGRTLENKLTNALQAIPFWYPSYADGNYINDTLTIRAAVFPDIKERKLRFFDVSIQRVKGI